MLFDPDDTKENMVSKVQKLFYVACSRTKSNLICVRLIIQDEEVSFKEYFPSAQMINLES